MVRHLLALPSWVKGGVLAGSIPAVVLAAALIVGSAGGNSGNTEQGSRQVAAAPQPPTPASTAAPTVNPATNPITAEPPPSEGPATPEPIQPTPQIIVVEVTPPPPPEPPPPPPPAPAISGEEAKALALQWLVSQGATWYSAVTVHVPSGVGGHIVGARLWADQCAMSWEPTRWTVNGPVTADYPCERSCDGTFSMWVFETTLTVTWAA